MGPFRMGLVCAYCGAHCMQSFSQHYRQSSMCKEKEQERLLLASGTVCSDVQPDDEAAGMPADNTANIAFYHALQAQVMKGFNGLFKKYAKSSELNVVSVLCTGVIDTVANEIQSITDGSVVGTEVREVFRIARKVIAETHSEKKRDTYNINTLKVPYMEPKLFTSLGEQASRKTAVRFSLVESLVRLLQTSPTARV